MDEQTLHDEIITLHDGMSSVHEENETLHDRKNKRRRYVLQGVGGNAVVVQRLVLHGFGEGGMTDKFDGGCCKKVIMVQYRRFQLSRRTMKEKNIIDRPDSLARLISSMGNGSVKIVTGLRRCGKSFLLDVIFRSYLKSHGVDDDHITAVALDRDEFESLQNPRNLSSFVKARLKNDGRMNYVFIDEIQLSYKVRKSGVDEKDVAPEDRDSLWLTFYDVLNSLNAKSDVDVYVTGSNSKMLSADVATNFRGRKTEIALMPLSFAEFHAFRGGDKADDWQEYMAFGGLPQVVLAPSDKEKYAVLDELFSRVYLKDVVERNKIADVGMLGNVVKFLYSSVGSLTNPTRIAKAMRNQGIAAPSAPTVRKFLDCLSQAYLFRKAERYDIRGKRYLDYPAKYYAEDVGVRNAQLGFREQEETHLMENVIFNELLRRGYRVDVGVVEIESKEKGKRELRQHEIDFVVNTGFGKIYIQSAYGIGDPRQMARETLPLAHTGDVFRRLIVTNGNGRFWTDNAGISRVGLYPFLLDQSILEDMK